MVFHHRPVFLLAENDSDGGVLVLLAWIFGAESVVYMRQFYSDTTTMKNSNHWLEKSPGRITSQSRANASKDRLIYLDAHPVDPDREFVFQR